MKKWWLFGSCGLLQLCLQSSPTWADASQHLAQSMRETQVQTQTAIAASPPSPCNMSTSVVAADPLTCDDEGEADPMAQVRSVNQLSDVQPTDWAYQALKSLVEKYGVISGYPDGTFRGDRPLSRFEFAATMNAVMSQVEQLFIAGEIGKVREDFATIRRLQASYDQSLNGLGDRIQKLELLTSRLEKQQFSTTTMLRGQTVLALSDGSNANSAALARVRLDFNTSFSGTDLLRTQLEAGSNSGDAISKIQSTRGPNLLGTNGILADGGGLDFVNIPNTVRISKLYYTFTPAKNLALTVGARLNPRDFIDYNRFANDSQRNFSSSFFMNNPLIVQNPVDRPGGAGAALSWQPADNSPFTVRTLYVAADADNSGLGLFGGNNQGTVELEYAVNPELIARLQYTSATVNRTAINAGGFNVEWVFSRQFAIFGRAGIGSYNGFNSALNRNLNLSPFTWAVGGTIRNIAIPGSVAGLAIGQPFVEGAIGNATQTNIEAYYSFNLNDSVSLSPSFLIVSNPNNRSIGTIFEWVLRLVYAF